MNAQAEFQVAGVFAWLVMRPNVVGLLIDKLGFEAWKWFRTLVNEKLIAMKKAGAQAELHVYTKVGHGFGVRATTKGPVAEWPQRFYDWMDARGFLKRAS